jgi:hypothetical protein
VATCFAFEGSRIVLGTDLIIDENQGLIYELGGRQPALYVKTPSMNPVVEVDKSSDEIWG